jgi:hypothetical protein
MAIQEEINEFPISFFVKAAYFGSVAFSIAAPANLEEGSNS